MTDHLEPCIACGFNGPWPTPVHLPGLIFGNAAKIYICPQCQCGITSPPPQTNISFYEQNAKYEELFLQQRPLYMQFAQELLSTLDFLPNNEKHKKLLDIGCGSGALVEQATAMGYQAAGLEANSAAVAFCQKRGLNVTNADFSGLAQLPSHDFDTVVLSAVLEHVEDPLALLLEAKRLVSRDGVLLISQADHTGFLPHLAPWLWYGWQPQEHFWHFSEHSLTLLLEQAGFNLAHVRKRPLHHTWYWGHSIKQLIGKNAATFLARFGNAIGKPDSYDILARPANSRD